MKVRDLYKHLDPEQMTKDAENAEHVYHTQAASFVNQVWDRDVEMLSKKQVAWLEKISEDQRQ